MVGAGFSDKALGVQPPEMGDFGESGGVWCSGFDWGQRSRRRHPSGVPVMGSGSAGRHGHTTSNDTAKNVSLQSWKAAVTWKRK